MSPHMDTDASLQTSLPPTLNHTRPVLCGHRLYWNKVSGCLVLGVVQTLPCTRTPDQEGTRGGLASRWGCACQACGPGAGAVSAKSKVRSEGALFLISLPRGGAFGNSSALRGYLFLACTKSLCMEESGHGILMGESCAT